MSKEIKNTELLTTKQVAKAVGVTPLTITNWYEWFKITPKEDRPEGTPELPTYLRFGHSKNGPKMWRVDDVPKLIEFKNWIPRGRQGVMAEVSKKFWSSKYYTPKQK